MTRRRLTTQLLIVFSAAALGVAAQSALGDGGPVTVPTTTVGSVPAPDPTPPPQPQPRPKPKPVVHAPAPKPAPAPSSQPTQSVSPAPATSSRPSSQPRTVAPKPKPARPKPTPTHHTHPNTTGHQPPVGPSKAGAEAPKPIAAPAGQGGGTHISRSLLFVALAAGLMGLLLLKVLLSSGRTRPATATVRAPLRGLLKRRSPREVMAELVHAPAPPLPSGPTVAPPRPRRETPLEAPVFDPEVLLPSPPPVAEPSPQEDEPAAETLEEAPAAPPMSTPAPTPTQTAAAATEPAPTARSPQAAVADREEPVEAVAAVEAEEPVATEEFCEIALWRGYAKSRFYARLDAADDEFEFAVAESPTFRYRSEGRNGSPQQTRAAEQAHTALVEALLAHGWEIEDGPGPWYASRFRRPLRRSHV